MNADRTIVRSAKIAKDRPKLEGKTLPLMNADTADLKKE
jgi:hypothetical protein